MEPNPALRFLLQKTESLPAVKVRTVCKLPKLDEDQQIKYTPSFYMKERLLDTHERHELLRKQLQKFNFSNSELELRVEPAMIVFQNFEIGKTNRASITIRNCDKQSQKVCLQMDESYAFKISDQSKRVIKLASGMFVKINVYFKPSEDADHYHKLILVSNTQRVSVPIVAYGGRGFLDIPDCIDFGQVLVKSSPTKIVPVFNIGTKTAKFTIRPVLGLLSVYPESGALAVKECMSLEISTFSEKAGLFNGELQVSYDTGDEVFIKTKANFIEIPVDVYPQELLFEDTFRGLKSTGKVTIRNKSKEKLKFTWKKKPSSQELDKVISEVSLPTAEMEKLSENLSSRMNISQRIRLFQHPDEDQNLYNDTVFAIESLTGEVAPMSSSTCFVTFSPHIDDDHYNLAYLELTGISHSIPIKFSGMGLGVKFQFGFDELRIGNVYIGGCHSYEFPVCNVSEIDGEVMFTGSEGLMTDLHFSVNPKRLSLSSGQYGAFYITFCSISIPGEIMERLNFKTLESKGQLFTLTLKGVLNYPSIHFSVPEIDFGAVSYGFPKSIPAMLVNETFNNLDISLKVDEPGTDKEIDHTDIIESFKNPQYEFSKNPRQFIVSPERFALSPGGVQRFTLTVVSCAITELQYNLLACLGGSDHIMTSIPISAKCIVPSIVMDPSKIKMHECHANYPYDFEMVIKNMTGLDSCYCIVPSDVHKLSFNSDHFVGVARAMQYTKVPATASCLQPTTCSATFNLFVVGQDDKVSTLEVTCLGVPSRIKAGLNSLEFEEAQLLQYHTKSIQIFNKSPVESPIKAFIAKSGKDGEIWDVAPKDAVIPANSSLFLDVTVRVMEVKKHSATLRIQGCTENKDNFVMIPLFAYGKGVSLTFTPDLGEIHDFGRLTTNIEESFTFEVKNVGFYPRVLEWKSEKEDFPLKATSDRSKKLKKKSIDPINKFNLMKSPFSVNATAKLVPPEQSMHVTISAKSKMTQNAEETFVLWSYAQMPKGEKSNVSSNPTQGARSNGDKEKTDHSSSLETHEIVAKLKVTAKFEPPQLLFSTDILVLRINAPPHLHDLESKKNLKVQNIGNLPIKLMFRTESPFSFLPPSGIGETTCWEMQMTPKQEIEFPICFKVSNMRRDKGNAYFKKDLHVIYQDISGRETLPLKGEIYFPRVGASPKSVDFGTIPNGMEAIEDISITNPANYCITYKWYIKRNKTEIEHSGCSTEKTLDGFGDLKSKYNLGPFDDDSDTKMYDDLKRSSSAESLFNLKSIASTELRVLGSNSETFIRNYGDTVLLLRDKIHRAKMMQFLGLKDPTVEVNDEITYLNYFQEEELGIDTVPINEIIDITPQSGVVQAGQTQRFTLVFYGLPNISFKASIICYIEGGTPQVIQVKGKSSPPIFSSSLFVTKESFLENKSQKLDVSQSVPPISSKATFKLKASFGQARSINIPVVNKSKRPQVVKTSVMGNFFSGPPTISLNPRSKVEYPVSFQPPHNTKDRFIEGFVYFNFPDGARILYRLEGEIIENHRRYDAPKH